MKLVKFPKVLHLDKIPHITNDGYICVTEKVDGSQCRILLTPDSYDVGSKNVDGLYNIDQQLFDGIHDVVHNVWERYKANNLDKYGSLLLFCEWLKEPKHNTIQYDRIPKNHLYLFGAMYLDTDGKPIHGFNRVIELSPEYLSQLAYILDIEPPYVLYTGNAWELNLDRLHNDVINNEIESCLGGDIEGVVITNYSKTYEPPYPTHWIGFPLRAKIVRQEFVETNTQEWSKKKKPLMDKLIEAFVTEQRLLKVIQHLREEGKITNNMRDLKYITEEYWSDLIDEEAHTIAQLVIEEIRQKGNKILARLYKEWIQNV